MIKGKISESLLKCSKTLKLKVKKPKRICLKKILSEINGR